MATASRSARISRTRTSQRMRQSFALTRRASEATITAMASLTMDLISPSSSAEVLMAAHARTFRFATRFLPDRYRFDTIRLYSFFRTLDDLVDEQQREGWSVEKVEQELEDWQQWFEQDLIGEAPRAEIGVPLADVVRRHHIEKRYFLDFLDGMRADLNPAIPTSRADVEHYSYQVASTVGLSMTHVFGATGSEVLNAATRLGIAMQITNILRDVGGDLARGRMYLPKADLVRNNLSVDDVELMWRSGKGPDNRYRQMMAGMVEWADETYEAGIAGIALLPKDVQMPMMVAARLYQFILRQLERNDYDSLRTRAATTQWQKLREASRCMVQPVEQFDQYARASVSHKQARVE